MGVFASEQLGFGGHLVHLGARAGTDLLKVPRGWGEGTEATQSVLPSVKWSTSFLGQWSGWWSPPSLFQMLT